MNLHDRDNFRRGLKEGIAEGISQGSQQKAIETAKNLLNLGDSVEKVAQVTGLSIEEIKALTK
jgi:predicted transposase/invertase (TIGR01784 family)